MNLKIGSFARKGEAVTSEKWNELIHQVRRVLRFKGGRGLRGQFTPDGLAMALIAAKNSSILLARITRVYGSSPDLQSNVKYDVKAVEETGCTMTNVAPVMGRLANTAQAANMRIYPAALGSLCYIVRNRQPDASVNAELWLPAGAETPRLKVCGVP